MSQFSRCVALLIAVVVASGILAAPARAETKYAAYVIYADSGDVLFDRYSTGRRYPASLTKMMTLYLLFEELDAGRLTLDSKLTISARAAGQPPSKLGLTPGTTIDVKTAIDALIVKSANDVAVVVAENISGSEWQFARKMTAKARALGMYRTTYRNASGLPNTKQVTTARDLATLGQRLIQDFPQYFSYFNDRSFVWNGRTYATHNGLLKTFTGADGLKTGYTRRSGFNLVTTAERDGRRLIGVVLGGRSSRTRDAHMREILANAFAAIKSKPTLIASLYRDTPAPRLKPTLVAALEKQKAAAPTIAANEPLRQELTLAAASMSSDTAEAPLSDRLGALIAAADADDFNESEGARIAALDASDGFIGEGDRQAVNEFNWGVQIGAYSDKSLAQKELEAAAGRIQMTDRTRLVMPVERKDGSTLYRARFTDLSEIEAAAACSALKDKGVSCFVVPEEQS